MNINRISVFAVCFAVGLAVVSEPSMARGKRKAPPKSPPPSSEPLPSDSGSTANSNSTGYPNGRPFQAIEVDFNELHLRFDSLDTDLDTIDQNLIRIGQAVVRVEENTNAIDQNLIRIGQAVVRVEENTNTIIGKVDDIAADVTMLKNTLEVQVSVEAATVEERNAGVDSDVMLYVQVIRNGVGVDNLPLAAFTYGNSFPPAAADICGGVTCFVEGVGGMYAIKLSVDESDNTFAGTLMVQDRAGAGTSQVTFDIPAAPVVPAP